ncbi:hypothetical protein KR200_003935, partial [Drosophila serrata]
MTPNPKDYAHNEEVGDRTKPTGVLFESDMGTDDGALTTYSGKFKQAQTWKQSLVWRNIIIFTVLHIASLYGGYLLVTQTKPATILFTFVIYSLGMLGLTAGTHRLWSHRSYKAKWPARLFLVILNCLTFQDSIFVWVRDHRMHHKYSETDADPHNTSRGFFYSHIGWLLVKKHPDVTIKGKGLDLSDIRADPIVMFQHKYYYYLMPLGCFILPTLIPWLCWNESLSSSYFVAAVLRWCVQLNMTWMINSSAHAWGNKPYDKAMNPSQNSFVSLMTFGEGWHNFHHVFPWDYRTAEWGGYSLSHATILINLFAKIGWAYDLKEVTPEMIKKRTLRTGDGTHELYG